ncbi:MAG: IS1634 family transposase [Candidatus Ozemobacteraceae bacterium]
MYIETIPNRNSPPAILLRESFREDGKVKKRTIANLSHLETHIVENLQRALKGGSISLPLQEAFSIIQSVPHGHVAAVYGTIRNLDLDRLLGSGANANRNLSLALIISRIIHPASKLATSISFAGDSILSTIPAELGLGNIDENDLYEAMDWLLLQQSRIEDSLADKHLHDGCLILYDTSSSYFEGKKCPLAKLGHSKDDKKGLLQIVYGFLTNAEGCPIAVEVFEGNTGDPTTLPSQLRKVQQRFGLKNVVVIGDRGTITSARLREDFISTDGIDWITALRAPAIQDLRDRKLLQPHLFDERDLGCISDPELRGERLVVCRNKQLAEERRRKREELLQATEKNLEKLTKATQRKNRPLRGEAKIGQRLGRFLNARKMGKHFICTITPDCFSYRRNEANIASEASLDGFYVIRTSVSEEKMLPEEVVAAYKSLSHVERAFRSLKGIDLQIRPIHHWKPDRVRAHVFLCVLAYYVEWHMRKDLKPLMYADEYPALAKEERESPVQSAKRSSKSQIKVQSGETEKDGLPLQSFMGLIANLGTIAKNTVQPKGEDGRSFEMLTTPSHLQAKALQLLKVKLKM